MPGLCVEKMSDAWGPPLRGDSMLSDASATARPGESPMVPLRTQSYESQTTPSPTCTSKMRSLTLASTPLKPRQLLSSPGIAMLVALLVPTEL